ncbi:phosphatidate cytidylyltransferase [Flavobacterium sp. AS60]|uniref:phosphatidate cytidylyltransferase n=1 Tax=Flavobacterium anseongense TaxID=2910677 RepID=UPI001F3C9DF3|nr:phosphatidate cytidylyltransferase [Flavobacterium sp. AS60]MCF6129956.1 phosphatidate cytidylyltransferase [Flavobacterium sp. AS60]
MNETLKRLLSGVVYVALLIIATSYSVNSFYLLFGVFMIIAVYEFCQLIHLNKIAPIILGTAAYCLATQYRTNQTNDLLLLIATLFVSVKCLLLLFDSKKERFDNASKYVYTIGYVILPFIIISKIPFSYNTFRPKIIISIFILIWTNDTFAYIVGKSIGKHKLIERISPKKTIEGFIGGIVFSVIAGILISKFYFQPKPNYANTSIIIWTISAVIISIFSTLGDLIESKFKRIAGVKDSGNIMPGHGGILDRLDSIIFVAPFVYLFYQILYYVS